MGRPLGPSLASGFGIVHRYLSDSQAWDTPLQVELRNSFRVVQPELQVIVLGGSSYAVLDPVTVEERPIRRFG